MFHVMSLQSALREDRRHSHGSFIKNQVSTERIHVGLLGVKVCPSPNLKNTGTYDCGNCCSCFSNCCVNEPFQPHMVSQREKAEDVVKHVNAS